MLFALPSPAGQLASQSIESTAHAIVSSPAWSNLRSAVMIVRPSPDPRLGVLGRFSSADLDRLNHLQSRLQHQSIRHVDYPQAEADCEELAHRLRRRLGKRVLAECRFEAIPRGGLIVLGMLAYWLDLGPERLRPARNPGVPLVVVDDCALTGLRFKRWLRGRNAERIVFAPLYSHPRLRRAVRRIEPSVMACISARNLVSDCSKGSTPAARRAWRAWWRNQESNADRFCYDPVESVTFAWNEPDSAFWNSQSGGFEDGWRLAAPDRCLRNRVRPTSDGSIQVQPAGNGEWIPSARLLFGSFENEVVLCDLERGCCFALDDSGAAMFQALIEEPTEARALARLRKLYKVTPGRLRADFQRFIAQLTECGLLQPRL